MSAFGRVQKTGDKVICCADPQMKFLRPAGLVQDLSQVGFGERAKRFALVIDDLKVCRRARTQAFSSTNANSGTSSLAGHLRRRGDRPW